MSFYQLSMNPVSLELNGALRVRQAYLMGSRPACHTRLCSASHSRLLFSFQVLSHAQSATDFETVCLTRVNLRRSVGLMFGVLERPIRAVVATSCIAAAATTALGAYFEHWHVVYPMTAGCVCGIFAYTATITCRRAAPPKVSPLSLREASLVALFGSGYISAQIYVWAVEFIGSLDRVKFLVELIALGCAVSALFSIFFAIACTNQSAADWLGRSKYE